MNKLATRENDILLLILEIKDAIKTDWNKARAEGKRPRSYSQDQFQKDLNATYPDVGTFTLLKTALQYKKEMEADPDLVKGMDETKLTRLLEFIYKDHADLNWANVTKVVRAFDDGAFYDKIVNLLPTFQAKEVKDLLDTRQLVAAGASGGEDLHIQLIQLAIKAKADSEAKAIKLATMEKENKELVQQTKLKQELLIRLRERIAVIQAKMKDNPNSTPAMEKEVDEMKNLLD